jgi:hypothetical protein
MPLAYFELRLAPDHIGRRRPSRPPCLALDDGPAAPAEALAAHADAISQRLAALHHQIEKPPIGIDDDGARKLRGSVADELAQIAPVDPVNVDRRDRERLVGMAAYGEVSQRGGASARRRFRPLPAGRCGHNAGRGQQKGAAIDRQPTSSVVSRYHSRGHGKLPCSRKTKRWPETKTVRPASAAAVREGSCHISAWRRASAAAAEWRSEGPAARPVTVLPEAPMQSLHSCTTWRVRRCRAPCPEPSPTANGAQNQAPAGV